MERYNYRFKSGALKQFSKLPVKVQQRIIHRLDHYVTVAPFLYSIKLKDQQRDIYRIRVGDYRVIFEIVVTTIKILKVGHRRDVYK